MRSHAPDYGRADEDRLHFALVRAGCEFRFRSYVRHAAIDLPAVGITFHIDIHQAQALLRWLRDAGSQKNGARASAEDGTAPSEVRHRPKQSFFAQQFKHGGAFTTGDNQAVNTIQIGGLADKHGFHAESLKRAGVRLEIAL